MKRHTRNDKCPGVDNNVPAQGVPTLDTTMTAPSIDFDATLHSLGLTLDDYPIEPQSTGDLTALRFDVASEASWTALFSLPASPFPTSANTAAQGEGMVYEFENIGEGGPIPHVHAGLDSEYTVELPTRSLQRGFSAGPRFGSAVGVVMGSTFNHVQDGDGLSLDLAGSGDLSSSSRKRSRESEASRASKRLQPDHIVGSARGESAAQWTEVATDSAIARWEQSNGYSLRPASPGEGDQVEHLPVVSRSQIPTEANQLASFRRAESQPRTYRAYTSQSWSKSEKHSASRSSTTITQILAVKTFMASERGRHLLTSDRRTLKWELVRKGAKLTYTHSVLSGDQILFKNSRFPRILDDNAEIFRLCKMGQYDEVNKWLSVGKASVLDVDSEGRALLDVRLRWDAEVFAHLKLTKRSHSTQHHTAERTYAGFFWRKVPTFTHVLGSVKVRSGGRLSVRRPSDQLAGVGRTRIVPALGLTKPKGSWLTLYESS
ncbi:hypothetical protein LTR53_001303 [Teratosphaeriaceae sp. CCFEE 6253]|nr:hypothetical protein LTR53_001303 [Teratosphaeriaceae sp. CCFEE 6253]